LAGVSTPTISHFEGGERDIQLSTVTNIRSR
jgi:predicted transcriptional regulator